MRVNYNCTGDRKKQMVKAIGVALEEKPVYRGTPSCAHQIAEFTVTREGNLEFPDDTDHDIVNGLLDRLEEAGFQFPEATPASGSGADSVITEVDNSMVMEAGTDDSVVSDETEGDEIENNEDTKRSDAVPALQWKRRNGGSENQMALQGTNHKVQ